MWQEQGRGVIARLLLHTQPCTDGFAARLKVIIKQAGISQSEFARRIGTCVVFFNC